MNVWLAGLIAYALVAPQVSARRAMPLDALPLQVALDRAGFSVGEIDGHFGDKTLKALHAFQQARGLSVSDAPDDATWTALSDPQTHAPVPPTIAYTITEEDARGPFVAKIPKDPVEQGKLPHLGYRSIVEMLAERFHASPTLLRRLNAGARTKFTARSILTVPNVNPLVPPQSSGRRRDAEMNGPAPAMEVVVSKETNEAVALDANGATIFYAPVSSGSEHDPLPIGDWTVRGVYLNPPFQYNPDLFWDADPSHTKTRIAPGPNNPVGFVWIDLDRPHYGLHGTPEPSMLGITQSHGCVRLTNWDAVRLATLVREGTHVSFRPRLVQPTANVTNERDAPLDPILRELQGRHVNVPVAGVRPDQLVSSFRDTRGAHPHEALDIPAPRGTPVIAVEDGTIEKLFWSKQGGHTIYQFDPTRRFAYYYAHLDRYASGLKEGQRVRRGDTIGFVGSSGNASAASPHLHFGIFVLTPARQWWKGTAVDPYPVLRPSSDCGAKRATPSARVRERNQR